MTKIAIPTKGSSVDGHFGHCEFFSIIELNDNQEIVQQYAKTSAEGCGCKSNLAEELAQDGVTLLLAGGIGQGAIQKLKAQNITVLTGFSGTIEEAVNQWKNKDYHTDLSICTEHHGNCEH